MPDNQNPNPNNLDPNSPEFSMRVDISAQANGYSEAIKLVALLEQNLNSIKKTTSGYDKAITSHGKTLSSYQNSLKGLSKHLKNVFDSNLFKSSKTGIENATRRIQQAVGISFGAVIISVRSTGRALRDFQSSSVDSTNALLKLQSNYSKLGISAANATISLKHAAEVLTEFQSQGVAEAVAATNNQFQKGFLGLDKIILESFGKDATKNISKLMSGLQNQFGFMQRQIKEISTYTEDYEINIGVNNVEGAVKSIRNLESIIANMAEQSDSSGRLAAIQLLSQLQSAAQNLQKQSPGAVAATIALNKSWSALKSTIEDAQAVILETIGPSLAKLVNEVSQYINVNLRKALNSFDKYLNNLDFDKISKSASSIWETIKSGIESVVNLLKIVYEWFTKLSPEWQKYTLYAAGFAALMGPTTIISGTFKTLWAGLTKTYSLFAKNTKEVSKLKAIISSTGGVAAKAAKETASMSTATSAATSASEILDAQRKMQQSKGLISSLNPVSLGGMFGAKGVGIGGAAFGGAGQAIGGALGGAVGHFGGKHFARELGAEKLGVIDALSGMSGAFVAATLAGGPFVGLLAAGASGIGSFGEALFATHQTIQEVSKAYEVAEQQARKTTESFIKQRDAALTPFEKAKSKKSEAEQELRLYDLEDQGSPFADFFRDLLNIEKEIDPKLEKIRNKVKKATDEYNKLKPDFNVPEIVDAQSEKRKNDLLQQRHALVKQISSAQTESIGTHLKELERINNILNAENKLNQLKSQRQFIENEITTVQSYVTNDDSGNTEKALTRISELNAKLEDIDKQIEINAVFDTNIGVIEDSIKDINKLKLNKLDLNTEDAQKQVAKAKDSLKEIEDRLDSLSEQELSIVSPDSINKVKELKAELEKTTASINIASQSAVKFESAIVAVNNLRESISKLGETGSQVTSIIEALGPAATIGGRKASDLLFQNLQYSINALSLSRSASEDAIKSAEEMYTRAVDEAKASTQELKRAQEEYSEALASNDTGRQTKSEENLNEARRKALEAQIKVSSRQGELTKSREGIESAAQQYVKSLKEAGKLAEEEHAMQKLTTGLIETNLRMSKATYGTAALAVQQQLDYVESLGKERQILIKNATLYKENFEYLKKNGASAEELWSVYKLWVDAQTKVRDLQAQQLESAKELRDGYLQAVEANAFSAGKFEKILITQEKNLGYALDNNIAKVNFLLGAVGDVARKSDIDPFRFGTGGYGELTALSGEILSKEQIQSLSTNILQNITDPASKMAAEAAGSIIHDVFPTFEEAFNSTANATNSLTTATKENTDAIEQYTQETQRMTGHLGAYTSPAGKTGIAESTRRVAKSEEPNIPTAKTPTITQEFKEYTTPTFETNTYNNIINNNTPEIAKDTPQPEINIVNNNPLKDISLNASINALVLAINNNTTAIENSTKELSKQINIHTENVATIDGRQKRQQEENQNSQSINAPGLNTRPIQYKPDEISLPKSPTVSETTETNRKQSFIPFNVQNLISNFLTVPPPRLESKNVTNQEVANVPNNPELNVSLEIPFFNPIIPKTQSPDSPKNIPVQKETQSIPGINNYQDIKDILANFKVPQIEIIEQTSNKSDELDRINLDLNSKVSKLDKLNKERDEIGNKDKIDSNLETFKNKKIELKIEFDKVAKQKQDEEAKLVALEENYKKERPVFGTRSKAKIDAKYEKETSQTKNEIDKLSTTLRQLLKERESTDINLNRAESDKNLYEQRNQEVHVAQTEIKVLENRKKQIVEPVRKIFTYVPEFNELNTTEQNEFIDKFISNFDRLYTYDIKKIKEQSNSVDEYYQKWEVLLSLISKSADRIKTNLPDNALGIRAIPNNQTANETNTNNVNSPLGSFQNVVNSSLSTASEIQGVISKTVTGSLDTIKNVIASTVNKISEIHGGVFNALISSAQKSSSDNPDNKEKPKTYSKSDIEKHNKEMADAVASIESSRGPTTTVNEYGTINLDQAKKYGIDSVGGSYKIPHKVNLGNANIHGFDLRSYKEVSEARDHNKQFYSKYHHNRKISETLSSKVGNENYIQRAMPQTNLNYAMKDSIASESSVKQASEKTELLSTSSKKSSRSVPTISSGSGGEMTKMMRIAANILVEAGAKMDELSSQNVNEPVYDRQTTMSRNIPG